HGERGADGAAGGAPAPDAPGNAGDERRAGRAAARAGGRVTPNIQKSGSNLHGGDEMSQRLTERFFKRQEKSDFFQKDVKRLLTKPRRRGIFITLIST